MHVTFSYLSVSAEGWIDIILPPHQQSNLNYLRSCLLDKMMSYDNLVVVRQHQVVLA